MTFLAKDKERFKNWIYLHTTRTLYPNFRSMFEDVGFPANGATAEDLERELANDDGFAELWLNDYPNPYFLDVNLSIHCYRKPQPPYKHWIATSDLVMNYSKPIYVYQLQDVFPSVRFMARCFPRYEPSDIRVIICQFNRGFNFEYAIYHYYGRNFMFYKRDRNHYRPISWVANQKDVDRARDHYYRDHYQFYNHETMEMDYIPSSDFDYEMKINKAPYRIGEYKIPGVKYPGDPNYDINPRYRYTARFRDGVDIQPLEPDYYIW